LPAQSNIDMNAKSRGQGNDGMERYAACPAALDAAQRLPSNASPPCDIDLSKVFVDADSSEGVADADVVHWAIMRIGTSRPLGQSFTAVAKVIADPPAGRPLALDGMARNGQRVDSEWPL
jgi:hypothetical protein